MNSIVRGVVVDMIPKAQRKFLAVADCPFCHSSQTQGIANFAADGETVASYQVECMMCGASGPPQVLLTDATRKWNQRF